MIGKKSVADFVAVKTESLYNQGILRVKGQCGRRDHAQRDRALSS
jgi:hypothetical protein